MTKFSFLAIAVTAFAISSTGCSSAGKEAGDTTQGAAAASTVQSTTTSGMAPFVSYENAVTTARTTNKIIFADIYTDWCTWCKKLDQEVYSDPRVKDAFAKSFALTKINAESDVKHTVHGTSQTERDIATSWNVNAFPTLVFLDQTEKPIFAYAGYLPPEQFVKLLTFVSSGDYQKNGGDFRAWLGTHSG